MAYISDQIPLLTTAQRNTFALKNGVTTIKSADDVLNYFLYTYEYWRTPSPIETAWAVYESMHHSDFEKALNAWLADYDPLHNYDGTETTIDIRKEGTTTTTTAPDAQHNSVTTAALENTYSETENDVTTYDSQTPRLDNKSTVTEHGGNVTTYDLTNTATTTRTDTSITYDGETLTGSDVNIHKLEKGGNLGVTTSQQMITSEIEMRLKPLIKMYLDAFIKEYAYCVE